MPVFRDRASYGWVIVAAFFIYGMIMYGIHSSYGVFFKSIEAEFGLTRAATSAVFSVQNICGAFFAFAGGWAVDRFGARTIVLLVGFVAGLSLVLTSRTVALWQIFLTYSLLFAEIGCSYAVIMSTVTRWFDRHRGLAIGIAGTGPGSGSVTIVPFAAYLIATLDWRTAYLIVGLIAWAVIMPLSRLLRNPPHSRGAPEGADIAAVPRDTPALSATGFSLQEAIHTRSFWLLGGAWFANGFCNSFMLVHIAPHASDIGATAMQAATVLSLIGFSSTAGRILIGRISDSAGMKGTAVVCALLAASAMASLLWVRDLAGLYAFAIIYGLFFGGMGTPITALIGDIFGMRNIGTIMGSLQTTVGVGMFIGPALGGAIFDMNQSYALAFLLAALALFGVALMTGLVRKETRAGAVPSPAGERT